MPSCSERRLLALAWPSSWSPTKVSLLELLEVWTSSCLFLAPERTLRASLSSVTERIESVLNQKTQPQTPNVNHSERNLTHRNWCSTPVEGTETSRRPMWSVQSWQQSFSTWSKWRWMSSSLPKGVVQRGRNVEDCEAHAKLAIFIPCLMPHHNSSGM